MADGNVATGLSQDDDVLSEVAAWRADGTNVALATVVSTWGSSPVPSAVIWQSMKTANLWAPFQAAVSRARL